MPLQSQKTFIIIVPADGNVLKFYSCNSYDNNYEKQVVALLKKLLH